MEQAMDQVQTNKNSSTLVTRSPDGRITSGTPNPNGTHPSLYKQAVSIKQKYYKVFEELGSVKALKKWAKEEPREFYKLIVSILPKEMKVEHEGLVPNLTIVMSKGYEPKDNRMTIDVPIVKDAGNLTESPNMSPNKDKAGGAS